MPDAADTTSRTGGPRESGRLAVMISGGGRSLINLQDRIERGELAAQIVLVIASGACDGIARAQARGLKVVVMEGRIPAAALEDVLAAHGVDLVVLAGYLKLLAIPAAYEGRVINIHPALLPKFGGKGMHGEKVHAAVIAAGEAESGCTVHYCDANFDTGSVILQMRCPVLAGDTPVTLAARVFELEKEALPRAVGMVLKRALGTGH